MKKSFYVALAVASTTLMASLPANAETYAECVARVKKEYPVPPGNINEQNQMIQLECRDLKGKDEKPSGSD